ncbi:hypothetical protein CGC54_02485 [Capnocytophaga canimorsus]|uniref:Uncharacterized protein n=1 Tax=Capnocytophaga canimorsus TaxID=28188 RepID=A0AAC9Z280_9FLAO|nr:hypothetical protein CGC54_02485 [Capnocytophaga canimorsus]
MGEKGINIIRSFTPRIHKCGYLRNSKLWKQTSAKLHGDNKLRSMKSMQRTCKPIGGGKKMKAGYGGHFRAVQGFKYLGRVAPAGN